MYYLPRKARFDDSRVAESSKVLPRPLTDSYNLKAVVGLRKTVTRGKITPLLLG